MTPSFVVVGAYGGVGEALCRRLVQHGARVLMAGRDATRLAQLATDVGGETFALDATSAGEVEACLRRAQETFGRVDGVANCVGSLALTHRRLLRTNWVRTVAWSARGIVACALLVAPR